MHVQPLIDACLNVHLLMMNELKRFRYIPEKFWPFPAGYRTRMAPAYLAHIFSLFQRAEEFGWDYIRKHELRDCTIAHFLPYILSIFDMYMRDGLKGWINFPSTEQLARTAYSFEVAFRNCKTKADWCKPPEGTAGRKNWVSKVDWAAADRIDPRAVRATSFRHPEMDKEIRGEMQHTALLVTAEKKLEENAGAIVDRINCS